MHKINEGRTDNKPVSFAESYTSSFISQPFKEFFFNLSLHVFFYIFSTKYWLYKTAVTH